MELESTLTCLGARLRINGRGADTERTDAQYQWVQGSFHRHAVFVRAAEAQVCPRAVALVHMMIAIPHKYAVTQVVGFIKGKSAIHLARTYAALAIGGHL